MVFFSATDNLVWLGKLPGWDSSHAGATLQARPDHVSVVRANRYTHPPAGCTGAAGLAVAA